MKRDSTTSRLRDNIAQIKEYTEKHAELRRAHHFCYDKRLVFGSPHVDYLVMGINPGETEEDERRHKAPPVGEETSIFDFHLPNPTPAAKRWGSTAKFCCDSANVAFSNCFFWSSPKERDLQVRYGRNLDIHLRFCTKLNKDLLEIHRPRAVIFPGLSYIPRIVSLYELGEPIAKESEKKEESSRSTVTVNGLGYSPNIGAVRISAGQKKKR